MRFFSCLFTEHDLWLVALAAAICVLGAWISIRLFLRTRAAEREARPFWVFHGAVAAGSTIWCTHFVAMLAYRPGVPVSYDPTLTGISLLIAVVSAAVSLAIASGRGRLAPMLGGCMFGVGVSVMHYTGMAAFSIDGAIVWDMTYVAASLVLSLVLGAAAFVAATREGVVLQTRELLGTALLAGSIVALHFTGMAAVGIVPAVPQPGGATSEDAYGVLAVAVAAVGVLVLGTGLASQLLDRQATARTRARTKQILESSVDGIVIETAGRIVDCNEAFILLSGMQREALVGRTFAELVPRAPSSVDKLVRATLLTAAGALLPVEVAAREDRYERDDLTATRFYSVRDLRPRLAQEEKISYLASFDNLTGLPNRSSFLEHLDSQIETRPASARIALLAIDLDRFKEVNDVHGHAAGDHVLCVLSDRMRTAVGKEAFVARLGGDEFVATALVQDREQALGIASRLERELFATVPYDHVDLICGASIGISIFPDDAGSPATLMNNADLAMYRAKGSPGEAICFYEEGMDERVRERRAIALQLRTALAENQFFLVFQPQVSVRENEVTGYEALLRWRHPERGVLLPMEFIPIAEDTGLILPIGEWVLRTACREAASWDNELKIAVNVSALQVGSIDMPDVIHGILMETGLSPQRLEVEITETSLIQDAERTLHILRRIKAMGVSISMDDFGIGYSSLSTLRSFPFDKIKLDKSFMDDLDRGPQASAMIRAVLALGESLDIPILAEGVETEAQLEFLTQQGCTEIQGYLVGHPDESAAEPGTAEQNRILPPPVMRTPRTGSGRTGE
ncbi:MULTISPECIES: EAL domain-containing protein [unclassified Stappia]|uniref:bifunctional diguanylate cyclase/phosphodiesterase n=1 Tax=Stappia sp. 28M-7 TaxID=2762596 RepID=UPI000E726BD9|nr:EAL domain-containing protein [Stappia sp. 28M-7]